jgi:single-stranded-DNA-specific exonuclease
MTLASARWKVVPDVDADTIQVLSNELNVPRTLAQILAQRGYESPEDAKQFLRPSLDQLSDPFLLKDMHEAVEVIGRTVRAGETIVVHGDYDVDGQCSAALLTRLLRLAGANVIPFVPHRMRDGYDFGSAGLTIAREHNASLVVTCDCGVTAMDTVTQAKEAGIGIVITDHHLPRELPPADAVVDPRRPDCPSPCKDLCGTGVAFKLAQALCKELGLNDSTPMHFLDLVALATVADIVSLTGENRALARFGLKIIGRSRWPGIRALLEVSRLAGRQVRAGHVSFVLAPRLNAAGRLGDAGDGLELLLSDDEDEALRLARSLEAVNTRRQELDRGIHEEAIEEVEESVDIDATRGLVLAREGWHSGVIGIVASRIAEFYMRPTFLVALDGDEGRGSGRSIPGFDLHDALRDCADLLERWGGHQYAAGLTVSRNNVAAFREAFDAAARSRLSDEDLIPTQRIDIITQVEDLDDQLERLIAHLEPCGAGNPAPIFGVRQASARDVKTVGANHLKFSMGDGTGNIPAIGFGWSDRVGDGWWREPVDIAFRLDRNEWRGSSSLQARVVQIKTAD